MVGISLFLLQIKQQTIFDAASPQAENIRSLTYGFIIASSVLMLFVIALTVYIPIKYRAKKGEQKEPKQIQGNRKVEMVMVGVPLLLVIVFFFWSLNTMSAVLPARGNEQPDILLVGHQWWWEAKYPGKNVITANEIHLPVGRRILMKLNAADVIHDWWVPALGGKMDMIPGRDNYLYTTINKPGIYEGACSEFCGQQHAWMRIRVVAQTPAEFNKWLNERAELANKAQDSLGKKGEAIFMNASCGSCHRIAGTTANGAIGPDLTHFASRKTMLAGLMMNTPHNVDKWITDPQKVKPGAHMPRFIFGQDSIHAITAYLSKLN